MLPNTLVESESKIHECGLPTISIDTRGSSEYSNTPFSSPSAAFLKAAFTSFTVTGLLNKQVISTIEPSATGTRMAVPPILPSNAGNIFAIALPAPVVVGIIETAAALALRKSLCGASCKRWSPV